MRRLALLASAAAVTALAVAATPPPAGAFGTVNNILGQHSEHERVTRLALQCANGVQPPDCFQPVSLDNLAGKGGTYGAVGAPDDLPMHAFIDREYWHCDNADWIDASLHGVASYPQSRKDALDRLRSCLSWGKAMLYDGARSGWSLPVGTPDNGAIASAAQLIKSNGKVDSSNPGVGFLNPTCTYNGVQSRRAKCNVLEPFGYVLHMAEDFYSHTNWADLSAPGQRLSLGNPYGLGNRDVAPFLDLRRPLPSDDAIPANFTGSCYPKKNCAGRVIHGESSSDLGLNKDKALIDIRTGVASDPGTPRGAIVVDGVSNAQRAVDVAVREVRRQWEVFRAELAQRYGTDRAAKMICALVLDRAETCDTRNVVVAIDTSPPQRGARASAGGREAHAAKAAGRSLIAGLGRTDRVSVLSFDSVTGDHDPDPFVAPRRARIDDARRGDRAADPSVRRAGRGISRQGDPTVTTRPGPAGVAPSPEGAVVHGTEEGGHVHASAAARRPPLIALDATALALRRAAALLHNARVPSGQRGVVVVTQRIGDERAVVKALDALRARGIVVSLAVASDAPLPRALVAAVERTGGIAFASDDATELRRVARAAETSGLTRMDDHRPDQEATLSPAFPPLLGVTDRGGDVHDVERSAHDLTLTVRALDRRLEVAVTDTASGAVTTVTAPRGGNHEVTVRGPAGARYTAELSAGATR